MINSNCILSFISDRHYKTKKWQNPTIFVKDISGHFDILMSQYGQVKKILPFRAMSKRCKFSTPQEMRTKITPQTHPNTVNIQRHHPNTIQYPQNISQTFEHLTIEETNCTNRHSLTSPDTPRCCLRMAESVC